MTTYYRPFNERQIFGEEDVEAESLPLELANSKRKQYLGKLRAVKSTRSLGEGTYQHQNREDDQRCLPERGDLRFGMEDQDHGLNHSRDKLRASWNRRDPGEEGEPADDVGCFLLDRCRSELAHLECVSICGSLHCVLGQKSPNDTVLYAS